MPSITVYTTPTCPYCTLAKNFLKERKLAFTEIDVSQDAAKAEEMIKKSGQMGVPVLDIGGKIVVGFDLKKLSDLIGQQKTDSA